MCRLLGSYAVFWSARVLAPAVSKSNAVRTGEDIKG